MIILAAFCVIYAHGAQAFFDFRVGGYPAPMREYFNKRNLGVVNPLWRFNNINEYEDAGVYKEDTQLKDNCFYGAPEQDVSALDREMDQSTVASDLKIVPGAQPTDCMPMKTTRKMPITDLSPWYLTTIMNPNPAIREPYQGPVDDINKGSAYRGGENPILHRQRMVFPTPTMQIGCAQQPMIDNPDPYDPLWMRLELDNCLNQYILQHARFLRDPDADKGEYRGFNTGLCQPFTLNVPPTQRDKYEYAPSQYIGFAWAKLLVDSDFLVRKGLSRTEPDYRRMSGVKLVRKIDPPAERFGIILVEDLAESEDNGEVNLQFEKILDPSHPFSPRWDFARTDRSYSPFTTGYDGGGIRDVRCSDDVPVDLLHFRKSLFDRWVMQKISFNTACYNSWKCRLFVWWPSGCTSDAPCCSTRYNQQDKLLEPMRTATCGPPIQDLCNDIARPLTPLNTLKLRHIGKNNGADTTPAGQSDDVENFPNGVPEGYKFKDYFGDHKPYMRCWDSNVECGETSQVHKVDIEGRFGIPASARFVYNPDSKIGADYALMGAGREGESCLIGGTGALSLGSLPISPFYKGIDPITTWSELKLYYVRAMRLGVKCLAMEPKMFKPYGTEEYILGRYGVEFQLRTKSPPNKWSGGTGRLNNYVTLIHNLGWRGYVSDPNPLQRFPRFKGRAPVIQYGLDEAKPGEVLIFDDEVVMKAPAGQRRNPYLAIVTNVKNDFARRQNSEGTLIANPEITNSSPTDIDFVYAIVHDHGKYIDACGHSDEMGMGTEYAMTKDRLFPNQIERFAEVDRYTETCDDPRNSVCIEPLWDDIKRYVIKEDVGK